MLWLVRPRSPLRSSRQGNDCVILCSARLPPATHSTTDGGASGWGTIRHEWFCGRRSGANHFATTLHEPPIVGGGGGGPAVVLGGSDGRRGRQTRRHGDTETRRTCIRRSSWKDGPDRPQSAAGAVSRAYRREEAGAVARPSLDGAPAASRCAGGLKNAKNAKASEPMFFGVKAVNDCAASSYVAFIARK